MSDVTRLLHELSQGDQNAATQLYSLVYDELRSVAARQMAHERREHTLQPTALVNEAFLRLTGMTSTEAMANRRYFFSTAAEAMRRILVEYARSKARIKRGGDRQRAQVDIDALLMAEPDEELLSLHEALERFEKEDPTKAKLVELHIFSGLTLAEAGSCLDISLATANRSWKYARAWLYAAMEDSRKNASL